MLRTTFPLAIALVLPLACVAGAAAAEGLPLAIEWMPANSVLAVEVSNPGAVLDVLLRPKVLEVVTATPAYKRASSQPGFQQFQQVVRFLEGQLGTDWKTGLRKLTGGGVVLAVGPQGGLLVAADAQDGAMLKKLHDIIMGFAKADAAKQDKSGRVASADYQGVATWTFGGDEMHALLGNRLLWANKAPVLKAALDRRTQATREGLAASEGFRASRQDMGADAAARAYVSLASLKQHPPVQKVIAPAENPMAALLFAGVQEALRDSNRLVASLRPQGDVLTLRAMLDAKPAAASSNTFARPAAADGGALPNLAVPRQIAGISLYRDLPAFYAAKDKLFPERTSGLIFFENMMGIFFSGRDLTEDILAQVKPEIRVVVAEQAYDAEVGTPQVQLPAFAAIFRLRRPKEYADVVEAAWQKAVGLVSITRGQKAELGLVIDRLTHNQARYSVAYFPRVPNEDKTRLGIHFNFRPTLVKLDEYLVLSSAEGLAKDLIDALKKELAARPKPLAGVHSLIEIDGVQLASILGANHKTLVERNMVEKGNTQEQAETEVGMLTTIVKHLGRAKLTVAQNGARHEANLELKMHLP